MTSDVLARMPKAELHVHLEGTIAPETLWSMARRNRVALPVGSLEELRALYAFDGFDKFLSLWMAMCGCLRRAEDYEQMVDAFLQGCEAQNIRYVEAHFTPYNHEQSGFGGERALQIVSRRLQAAEAAGGPVARLIIDIPVQHGVRAAEDESTLRLLAERGVCCDVALTSNRFLTIYRDLAAHPLRRMMAAGIPVTLSTDDPPFFGTDLTREYRVAHETLGFSLAELWQINLNGLRYGLAETGRRRGLMQEFEVAGAALGI